MPGTAETVAPEEAWRAFERLLTPASPTVVSRPEALGRVLAAAVSATVDLPAHDVSAMDGYAVAGSLEAGTRLQVMGTVTAGDAPGVALPPGTAMRIMTGAPLPTGADRVVPVESTDDGDRSVSVEIPVSADANVRRRGEIIRAGELLLEAGAVLGPAALSVLAGHGVGSLEVLPPPQTALLTTGDEVVSPEALPAPGQIRDSHTDFLLAACGSTGIAARSIGKASDDREELTRLVRQGLEHRVLILCGGVSKGKRDLVRPVLEAAGCEVLVHGVAIQPGKPLLVASHGDGLVFGLPGNPNSVMACFWLFVRPALRRLCGLEDGFWQTVARGRLAAALPQAKERDRFIPATVRWQAGHAQLTPLASKGSHDQLAFATAEALIRVRADAGPAAPGDEVEFLPLPRW